MKLITISDCTSKLLFSSECKKNIFSSRSDFELQNFLEAFGSEEIAAVYIHISPLFYILIQNEGSFLKVFLKKLREFINSSSVPVVINKLSIHRNNATNLVRSNDLKLESFFYKNLVEISNQSKFLYILNLPTPDSISIKNYLLMRQPYKHAALQNIKLNYLEASSLYFTEPLKIVFVDADNTLWKGVVGEDGLSGIDVGFEYPGVVYRLFQNFLLSLKDSGKLLVLVTKNNESDILDLFAKTEMPLRLDDFILCYSNWERKSTNIQDALNRLSLSSSSAIFIDDSEYEISDVKSIHSDLECIKFCIDTFFEENASSRFFSPYITNEDSNKTQQYIEKFEREDLASKFDSILDYVSSLNVELDVHINDVNLIPRISQLCNKTNQFNLTTRRYSENDIRMFMGNGLVFAFSAKDKFGDLGVVGVVIFVADKIDTFLLSCRALGRFIEHNMLYFVLRHQNFSKEITAEFIPSKRNDQCSKFYLDNGFLFLNAESNVHSFKFSGEYVPELSFF